MLAFTSLSFVLPAARLLRGDCRAHAALLFVHSFFSVLFHTTHDVRVKRIDVTLSLLVFATAALWGVWEVWSPTVFLCLVVVAILWFNPITRHHGTLTLRAHICMHFVASVGLFHLPANQN